MLKNIKNYPEYTIDSETAEIRRTRIGKNTVDRLIKFQTSPTGYLTVVLCSSGKPRRFFVHRLVAEAFVPGKSPDTDIVNHIDGVQTNNACNNLEWVSQRKNVIHWLKASGKYVGGRKESRPDPNKGKNKTSFRLPAGSRTEIIHGYFNLGISRSEYAKKFGTSCAAICYVIKSSSYNGPAVPHGWSVLEGEEWRCIPGYPRCAASNLGRVRSVAGVVVTNQIHKSGYLWASLGSMGQAPVHKLVCLAFHGSRSYVNGWVVDHINRNKQDNRESNLRWSSVRDNKINGLSDTVASNELVKYISDNAANGVSRIALAERTGLSRQAVGRIALGKSFDWIAREPVDYRKYCGECAPTEIWKSSDIYSLKASDRGNVADLVTGNSRSAIDRKDRKSLFLNVIKVSTGRPTQIQLKYLIATLFVPRKGCLKYVGHKDGDYRNCRADNLYWKPTQI
jgi:HNH endonuclease